MEPEWKVIEEYYLAKLNRERVQKELSQGLVKSLTEQLKQKNSELEKLEYFITSLTLSLKLSSDYVLDLRKQLQKNG